MRTFLMLQGVCSPFFAALGRALRAGGARVQKVSFNAGDLVSWGLAGSWAFRDALTALPEFLEQRCARAGLEVTDQILFGDCRPVHRAAIAWGTRRGVRTHVFEEGYLRPWWVTLERSGVNGRSALPRDAEWYRQMAARLPEEPPVEPFSARLLDRARHDVLYHACGALNPLLFPRYRTHAPVNAAVEYAAYARRYLRLRRQAAPDRARQELIQRSARPYYFLPLQLEADAQIREYSSFTGMRPVLATVLESFARAAPAGARLVVKNHPLDPGLCDHARDLAELGARFGLAERLEYLETGEVERLVTGARGVVTVNSTVGLLALGAGRPVKTLARPLYDLPGLTFQGPLDEFWQSGEPPEEALYGSFRRTLVHATQVNGGFYSASGIELAVRNSCRRLLAERAPLEDPA